MNDEERLQEYVDDRLSPAERKAFEAELARNPDLAAAARSALEIRRELREGSAELPAGFHARARARFESSRPTPVRLPRRLPWEVLGLAAAAALVFVVLFPWTRTSRPDLPVEPRVDLPRDAREPERPPSPPATSTVAAAKATAPVVTEVPTKPRLSSPADPEPSAGAVQLDEAPQPAPQLAPVLEKTAAAAAAKELPASSGDVALPIDRLRQAGRADQLQASIELLAESRAAELPPELLPRGASRIIDSASDELWLEIQRLDSGAVARKLAPDFDRERVFVFGAQRFTVSCRGIERTMRFNSVRIGAGPATSDRPESPGGCAVVIPRGNFPVGLDVPQEN